MYDIAVIGLGCAGLEVVNIALKNNLSVIAFEMGEIGGTYLNDGCIPLEVVTHSSLKLKEYNNCSSLGLNSFAETSFDWQKILDRKIEITTHFAKKNIDEIREKVKIVSSPAEITIDYDQIEIYADDNIYQAKNVIVATGSKPVEVNGLKRDGHFIITPSDLFKFKTLPKRVAVVGAGGVGFQLAKMLADFNCRVKLIEKKLILVYNKLLK